MGVDSTMPQTGLPAAAQPGELRQPDAEFFRALQTEVNDKGFVMTTTEEILRVTMAD